MQKILKQLVWLWVVFILTLWVWSYRGDVSFNAVTGLTFGLPALGAFLLLLSSMAMGNALFQNKFWSMGGSALVGLIYLYYFGITPLNLIGVAILILLGLYSYYRSIEEIKQRTKINPRRIIEAGSKGLVVGLFVLISFAVYQSPLAADLAKTQRLPSATESFVRTIVETTFGNQFNATPKEKQNIINQVTKETIGEMNLFLKPYFKYAPPILSFGLFLILWGLSSIFVWLSGWLGMLMFWILKKVGLVKIEEKDVKAEVLVV